MYSFSSMRTLNGRPASVFHRFEPPDHRLDAGAHLLATVQERSFLGRKGVLARTQCPVLLLELLHGREQLLDALFETFEL
jgi:hypothetical protein